MREPEQRLKEEHALEDLQQRENNRIAAGLMRELVGEQSAKLLAIEIAKRPLRNTDLVSDETDRTVQGPGDRKSRHQADFRRATQLFQECMGAMLAIERFPVSKGARGTHVIAPELDEQHARDERPEEPCGGAR